MFFAAWLGCAGLHEDLRRAQLAYESAAFEDALVWLSAVEPEVGQAPREERARYYYLRGMTSYRIGHRPDALHYLALALMEAGEEGLGLYPRWADTLQHTLEQLRGERPPEVPQVRPEPR